MLMIMDEWIFGNLNVIIYGLLQTHTCWQINRALSRYFEGALPFGFGYHWNIYTQSTDRPDTQRNVRARTHAWDAMNGLCLITRLRMKLRCVPLFSMLLCFSKFDFLLRRRLLVPKIVVGWGYIIYSSYVAVIIILCYICTLNILCTLTLFSVNSSTSVAINQQLARCGHTRIGQVWRLWCI